MLTHIVLWRLSDPDVAPSLIASLRGLVDMVEPLRSLEAGANVLASERAYDLGIVATFDDEAGLRAYQEHPDHVAFAAELRQYVTASASLDFVS